MGPVGSRSNVLLSRYLPAGSDWGLPSVGDALRVLAVVSSSYPSSHPLYIDFEAERTAIERTFQQFPGRIQCDYLPGPVTLEVIATALDSGKGYDVLHYAGHGAWVMEEGQACLVLEEPADGGVRGHYVFEREIIDRLRMTCRLPRLIALFACETAGQPAGSDSAVQRSVEGFMGLGPRLVQAGCPAVICIRDASRMKSPGISPRDFTWSCLGAAWSTSR